MTSYHAMPVAARTIGSYAERAHARRETFAASAINLARTIKRDFTPAAS
jgi:hypothetical protein